MTLCGFVNRWEVRVTSDRLSVVHRPLPWPGSAELASPDIEQLYCAHKVTQTKRSGGAVTYHSYEIRAITKDGRQLKLIGKLQEASQARFVEQQVERFLGIEDRHVPGEFQK
jgi:hypothetical protein